MAYAWWSIFPSLMKKSSTCSKKLISRGGNKRCCSTWPLLIWTSSNRKLLMHLVLQQKVWLHQMHGIPRTNFVRNTSSIDCIMLYTMSIVQSGLLRPCGSNSIRDTRSKMLAWRNWWSVSFFILQDGGTWRSNCEAKDWRRRSWFWKENWW